MPTTAKMGPLVDYSSSSSSSEDERSPNPASNALPPRKKRKTNPTAEPSLPDLPATFHDLYASTVRTATNDDPSLHQGRKRVIPHVAGNWPSHIYIEWHPSPSQHALLANLLDEVRSACGPVAGANTNGHGLTSFLTSDLGSPLPLHISLSRPIVLRTEQKDSFLVDISDLLSGGGGGGGQTAFEVGVHDLAWHRSPDSDRSFLVLRVRSTTCNGNLENDNNDDDDNNNKNTTKSPSTSAQHGTINPELTALLRRCNSIVAQYGQPRLYAQSPKSQQNKSLFPTGSKGRRSIKKSTTEAAAEEEDDGDEDSNDDDDDDADLHHQNEPAGNTSTTNVHVSETQEPDRIDGAAFHVSIAWSFAKRTTQMHNQTAAVFKRQEFQRRILGHEGMRIPVNSIKVKIGNAVTSIALAGAGSRLATLGNTKRGAGLFGI